MDGFAIRYSFTAQFIRTAVIFARKAADIEAMNPNTDQDLRAEHRGYVTAAIMHSAAAVEAESAEIAMHGLGHHLGGNGRDEHSIKMLTPIADIIDRQSSLDRFPLILHLLQKKELDKTKVTWRDMVMLVQARNELVHYKSKWGDEMDREKLFKKLQALNLREPYPDAGLQNFFPHKFLGAETAKWAARSAMNFINEFYAHVGIKSPLDGHMKHFTGI